mgnify:CR=1 FL=1
MNRIKSPCLLKKKWGHQKCRECDELGCKFGNSFKALDYNSFARLAFPQGLIDTRQEARRKPIYKVYDEEDIYL